MLCRLPGITPLGGDRFSVGEWGGESREPRGETGAPLPIRGTGPQPYVRAAVTARMPVGAFIPSAGPSDGVASAATVKGAIRHELPLHADGAGTRAAGHAVGGGGSHSPGQAGAGAPARHAGQPQ